MSFNPNFLPQLITPPMIWLLPTSPNSALPSCPVFTLLEQSSSLNLQGLCTLGFSYPSLTLLLSFISESKFNTYDSLPYSFVYFLYSFYYILYIYVYLSLIIVLVLSTPCSTRLPSPMRSHNKYTQNGERLQKWLKIDE